MFVAMEAQASCPSCEYQVRLIMTGSARINKRSVRVTGPFLGALEHSHCPRCGAEVGGDGAPRSAYRLCAEDEAKVVAYRERKWGITDAGTGPLVEARVPGQCRPARPAIGTVKAASPAARGEHEKGLSE
jgi:hypothetical protein